MTFDYIVNPETQRKVSIFSTKGRSILRNYLKVQNAGADSPKPKRPPSHCAGDVRPPCPEDCLEYTYTDRKTGAKERRCRKQNARSGSPKPKRPPSHCAGDVRPPCPEDCVEYTHTDRKTGTKERRCRKQKARSSSPRAGSDPRSVDEVAEEEHYGHVASALGHLDVSDSDAHSHEHHDHHLGRPAEYPHGGSPRYYY